MKKFKLSKKDEEMIAKKVRKVISSSEFKKVWMKFINTAEKFNKQQSQK